MQNWHENSHWTLTCRLFRFDSSKLTEVHYKRNDLGEKNCCIYSILYIPYYRKVYLGIPNLWAGQNKLGGQPLVEHKVDEQQVQIEDSSSPAGVNQLRVTASAVFRDKLYLACAEHERGLVKVFCLLKLSPLPSLLPSRADEERAPEGLLPVAPELAQCGSILATTSPCRRKVRSLFLAHIITDV